MIKIFAIHAQRTDFLELQYQSLKYWLKDSFEYYCIDNFHSKQDSENIKLTCNRLNINYIKFDTYELRGNAHDHAPALNSIKTISNDQDINVILDFDIFMIDSFCMSKYIENYDVAGMYQQRNNFELEYLAPFIVIVNSNQNFSSIDFQSCSHVLTDVGGNTYSYIKNKKVRWIQHTSALNTPSDVNCFNVDYDSSYGCQVLENSFLHYYRGTNWDNQSPEYQVKKTEWLKRVLDTSKIRSILNGDYLSKYQTPFSHSFNYWNGESQPFNSILNPYL